MCTWATPRAAGAGERDAREPLHRVRVHDVGPDVVQHRVERAPGARVVHVHRVEQQPPARGLGRRLLDRVRPRLHGGDDVRSLDPEGEHLHLVARGPQPARERRRVLLGATDDLRRPEVGDHQDAHRSALGYCRHAGTWRCRLPAAPRRRAGRHDRPSGRDRALHERARRGARPPRRRAPRRRRPGLGRRSRAPAGGRPPRTRCSPSPTLGQLGVALWERYASGRALREGRRRRSSTARSTSFPATSLPTVLTVHDVMTITRAHESSFAEAAVPPAPVPDVARRGRPASSPRARPPGTGCATSTRPGTHKTVRRAERAEPQPRRDARPEPVPGLVGTRFALVVGDLAPRKNVKMLLEHLGPDVARAAPDFRLVVLGHPGPAQRGDDHAARASSRPPGIAVLAPRRRRRRAALVLRARDRRAVPHARGGLRLPAARGADVPCPGDREHRSGPRRGGARAPSWSCTSTRPPGTRGCGRSRAPRPSRARRRSPPSHRPGPSPGKRTPRSWCRSTVASSPRSDRAAGHAPVRPTLLRPHTGTVAAGWQPYFVIRANACSRHRACSSSASSSWR